MANIIKSGDCRPQNSTKFWMKYTLTDDGVLTISGNDCLYSIYDAGWVDGREVDVSVSQFRELDFHTVVIEEGVSCLEQDCFTGCKGLKKIILPDTLLSVYRGFADDTPLEYLNEGGLLYLGTEENPHHILMGCTDDYNAERLEIAEGTVAIAHGAFSGRESIRDINFPASLRYLGRCAFYYTSIRHIRIPDGNLAHENNLLAFKKEQLETISVPYRLYKRYQVLKAYYEAHARKEDSDCWWKYFEYSTITFRGPFDSIQEVIPARKRI